MADGFNFITRDHIGGGMNRSPQPHLLGEEQWWTSLNIRFWQNRRLQIPRKVLVSTGPTALPVAPTEPYYMWCGPMPAADDLPPADTPTPGAIHGGGPPGSTPIGVGTGGIIAGDGSETGAVYGFFHGNAGHTGYGGCEWSVLYDPNPFEFEADGTPAGGGAGEISIDTYIGCSWTAEVDKDWISIDHAAGLSSGTIGVTVDANTARISRSGHVTIKSGVAFGAYPIGTTLAVVTVTQFGTCCDLDTAAIDVLILAIIERAELLNVDCEADGPWADPAYILLQDPAEEKATCTLQLAYWQSFIEEINAYAYGFYQGLKWPGAGATQYWLNSVEHPGGVITGDTTVTSFAGGDYPTMPVRGDYPVGDTGTCNWLIAFLAALEAPIVALEGISQTVSGAVSAATGVGTVGGDGWHLNFAAFKACVLAHITDGSNVQKRYANDGATACKYGDTLADPYGGSPWVTVYGGAAAYGPPGNQCWGGLTIGTEVFSAPATIYTGAKSLYAKYTAAGNTYFTIPAAGSPEDGKYGKFAAFSGTFPYTANHQSDAAAITGAMVDPGTPGTLIYKSSLSSAILVTLGNFTL